LHSHQWKNLGNGIKKNVFFACHCARLALRCLAAKIGGASAMASKKMYFLLAIALGLHYLCQLKQPF